eukprot:gene14031-30990_t
MRPGSVAYAGGEVGIMSGPASGAPTLHTKPQHYTGPNRYNDINAVHHRHSQYSIPSSAGPATSTRHRHASRQSGVWREDNYYGEEYDDMGWCPVIFLCLGLAAFALVVAYAAMLSDPGNSGGGGYATSGWNSNNEPAVRFYGRSVGADHARAPSWLDGGSSRSSSSSSNSVVGSTGFDALPPSIRGCGKWVVCYSMYGGASPRYTDGAFANTELIKAVFPGWVMRVYHDDTVPADILKELQQLGVELRDMTRSGLSNKMTWRFTAASDASVDRFLIRDLDSRLSIREKVAVDEWILSGKKFHVMRDHPSHSLFAMSGG